MKFRSIRAKKSFLFSALFLLAFATRLVFILQWHETPYGAAPLLDAAVYHQGAEAIAHGDFLRGKAFYQSPLYPYVLAIPYALFGANPLVASLFNALLDSGSCALLAIITASLFGPLSGVATGLLAIFNKQMIYGAAPVMKESLGLFLLTLFVFAALRLLKNKKARGFFLTGLLLGLAALTRGNVLFIAPVALGFLLWKDKTNRFKKAGLFIAGFLLAILPATLHNAIESRGFVPINYADGFNLYLGHFEGADGITYVFPDGIASGPEQEEHDTTWLAAKALGHPAAPAEVSRYWRGRALDVILQNPAHEIDLLKNKLFGLWNDGETFDNYDLPFVEAHFPTLLNAPLLGFWSLAFLAPLGFVAFFGKRRTETEFLLLSAASYAASLLVFYVTDRYRQPLVVFLFPLAGAGVAGLYRLIRDQNLGRLYAGLMIACLSLGFSLWPRPLAKDLSPYDWGMLAMIETGRAHFPAAVEDADKAIAIAPQEAGTITYIKGAYALEQMGRVEEAKALLHQGMAYYPDDGAITYELGRIEAAAGHIKEASMLFKQAMDESPAYLLASYGRAVTLLKLGDKEGAREVTERALALDPANAELLKVKAELEKR